MKIKTLILCLIATAALATATAASACHGGRHDGRRHGARLDARFHGVRANTMFVAFNKGVEHGVKVGDRDRSFARLSGTGTDFNGTNPSANGSIVGGNDHQGGTFTVGLNTTWSAAQTKTWTDDDGDADDGTVTVSCAPSTATLTLSSGSTSTYTLTGKTCSVTRDGATKYGFAGMSSDGVRAFLKEDGTTVKGVVFTDRGLHNGLFFGLRCDH